jgi:Holliday junction resolvase
MRAGGGKQKGASFERQVCRILSEWVSGGRHEDLFWRSAMSGGRATVRHRSSGGKVALRQSGDITAVSPEGHKLTDRFFIECKHVKDLQLIRFFVEHEGGPNSLMGFWRIAGAEAKKYGKLPLIIARQNNVTPIVVLPSIAELGSPWVQWTQLAGAGCKVCRLDDLISFPFAIGGRHAGPDHKRPSSQRPASRSLSPRVHDDDASAIRKVSRPRLRLDPR